MPDSFTQELRRACHGCAAVEFRLWGNGAAPLRLERGPELDALLQAITAEPRWYERRVLMAQINHEHAAQLRFLDAQGRELLDLRIYPEGPAHAREGLRYISLWEFCRRRLPTAPTCWNKYCVMQQGYTESG